MATLLVALVYAVPVAVAVVCAALIYCAIIRES